MIEMSASIPALVFMLGVATFLFLVFLPLIEGVRTHAEFDAWMRSLPFRSGHLRTLRFGAVSLMMLGLILLVCQASGLVS